MGRAGKAAEVVTTRLVEYRITFPVSVNEPFEVALPDSAEIVAYTSKRVFWYSFKESLADFSKDIEPDASYRHRLLVLADGSREFLGTWKHRGWVRYEHPHPAGAIGVLHLLERTS